jgi:hypothetical protein
VKCFPFGDDAPRKKPTVIITALSCCSKEICSPFIAGRGESMPTDSTGEKRCRTTTAEATAKFKEIANETAPPNLAWAAPAAKRLEG